MRQQKSLFDGYDLSTYLGYLQAIQSVMTAEMTKLEAVEFLIQVEKEGENDSLPPFFDQFKRFVTDSYSNLINK